VLELELVTIDDEDTAWLEALVVVDIVMEDASLEE
jgi:hypothetical protein